MNQNLTFEQIMEQRKEFQDILYRDYFKRSIKFVPNKQFAECNAVRMDELFKMDINGNYEREEVSAMWHGWKLARGIK